MHARIPIGGVAVAAAAAALALPAASGGAAADDAIVISSARAGNADLYVVSPAGKVLRRLTRTPGQEFAPAWSPDRRRIAYVSTADGDGEIWVVNADGTGARRLTANRAGDLSPAWSPDGTRIAFASRPGGQAEIWVMRADGSAARRLTRGAKPWNESYSPAFTPDGARILYSTAVDAFNTELFSIRPDGTGRRRLTHVPADDDTLGDDSMPDVSPDGRTVVFTSNRTQDGDVWTMRPDGTRQRRLAGFARTDEFRPRFSPDGTRILFVRLRQSGEARLYVARADGTGARPIGTASEADW